MTPPTRRPLVARLRAMARRPYLRLAVLSAVAAAVAYGIGMSVPMVSPVVAAITALISVRPTFHASLQEAVRQVLGVIVGALVAFAALQMLGYSAPALFVAILACFGVARWLRLGEEGAAAVGVTVILVVGPQFDAGAIETRLLGAFVGSMVALAMSFFTRPGAPHTRALAEVVTQADRTSSLLTTIAETLSRQGGRVPAVVARGWLAEAQQILRECMAIRGDAQEAVDGARFTPSVDAAEARAVLEQVRITEGTAVTLVSMCRDLLAAADKEQPLPAGLASSLSHVLHATAGAISEQSQGARAHPAETLAADTGPVGAARSRRKDATVAVRGMDDTMPLLLGGSLIRDTEKITDLLSGR